jgi:chemotaxis protein methyltransferase CheR
MDTSNIEIFKKHLSEFTALDFSIYRHEFFMQCVENRMRALNLLRIEDYLLRATRDNDETVRLLDAFSIYHSQFMRNSEKYEVLKGHVLPELIKKNEKTRKLSIYSAGCAGGEEPYSIAMVICEVLGLALDEWDVKINAVDFNGRLVEKASKGAYMQTEFANNDLVNYYRGKYFTRSEDSYIIRDQLRKIVEFSCSDISVPSQIQNMDIIFCRNVLIYFNHETCRKLLTSFHGKLNDGGYLFLGNSEILEDHFYCSFKKIKSHDEFIYRKITKGSEEFAEAQRTLKNIRAGLGIKND